MNDLVVVLPGIMGSVLERNGRIAWDAPVAAFWAAATSRGGSITELMLSGDDGRGEVAADGVVATRLVEDLAVIPFFWKIGAAWARFGAVTSGFAVVEVEPGADGA